jgi:hypothetical protein
VAERRSPTIPEIPHLADREALARQARASEPFNYANRPYLDTPDTDAVMARGPDAIAEGGERQLAQILRLPRTLAEPTPAESQPQKRLTHQESYRQTAAELQTALADLKKTLTLLPDEQRLVDDLDLQLNVFSEALARLNEPDTDHYRRSVAAWLAAKDLDYFLRVKQWFEESGLWGRYLERKMAGPRRLEGVSQPAGPSPLETNLSETATGQPKERRVEEEYVEGPRTDANGLILRDRQNEVSLPLAEEEGLLTYFGEIRSDAPLPEGMFATDVYSPSDAKGRKTRADGQKTALSLPTQVDFSRRPSTAIDISLPISNQDNKTHPLSLPMPFGYRVTGVSLIRGENSQPPEQLLSAEQNVFGLVTLTELDPSVSSVRYRLEPASPTVVTEIPPEWITSHAPSAPRPEDKFISEFLASGASRAEQANLLAGALRRRKPVYTTQVDFQRLMVSAPDFYAFQDKLSGPMGDCKHFSMVMANEFRRHGIPALVTDGLQIGVSYDGKHQFKSIGHEQTIYLDEAGQPQIYDAVRLTDQQTILNEEQFAIDLPTARVESQGPAERFHAYLKSRASAWRQPAAPNETREDMRAQGLEPNRLRSVETPQGDEAKRQAELFTNGLELSLGREAYETALAGEDVTDLLNAYAQLSLASGGLYEGLQRLRADGVVPPKSARELFRQDDALLRFQAARAWLDNRFNKPEVRRALVDAMSLYRDQQTRLEPTEDRLNSFSQGFIDRLETNDLNHLDLFHKTNLVQNILHRDYASNGEHAGFLLEVLKTTPEVAYQLNSESRRQCQGILRDALLAPKLEPTKIHNYLELASRLEADQFPTLASQLIIEMAGQEGERAKVDERWNLLTRDRLMSGYFTPDGLASPQLRQQLASHLERGAQQKKAVLFNGYYRQAAALIDRFRSVGMELKELMSAETAERLALIEYSTSPLRGHAGSEIGIFHQADGSVDPRRPVTELKAQDSINLQTYSLNKEASRSAAVFKGYLGEIPLASEVVLAEEEALATNWLHGLVESYLADPLNNRNLFDDQVLGEPVLIEQTLGQHPTVKRIKRLAGLADVTPQFATPKIEAAVALDSEAARQLEETYRDPVAGQKFESRYLGAYLKSVTTREQRAAGHLFIKQLDHLAGQADFDQATWQRLEEICTQLLFVVDEIPQAEVLNEQARIADLLRQKTLANLSPGPTKAELAATMKNLSPQILIAGVLNSLTQGASQELFGRENNPQFSPFNPQTVSRLAKDYPAAGLGLVSQIIKTSPATFWSDQLRYEMLELRTDQPEQQILEMSYFSEVADIYPAAEQFVRALPHAAETARRRVGGMGPAQLIRRFGQAQFAKAPSGEFHQLRDYQPGDDVKTIDWNATARLGKTVIKELRDQNDPQPYNYLVDVEWLGIGPKGKELSENTKRLVETLDQGLKSHTEQALHLTFRGNVILSVTSAELKVYLDPKAILDDDLGRRSKLLDFVLTLNYAAAMADHRVARKERTQKLPPFSTPLVQIEKTGRPWQPPGREGTVLIFSNNPATLKASTPIFREWSKNHFDIIKIDTAKVNKK